MSPAASALVVAAATGSPAPSAPVPVPEAADGALPDPGSHRLTSVPITPLAAPAAAPPAPAPVGPAAPPARPGMRLHYDVDSFDNRDPWFIENVVKVVEKVMVPWHRAEVTGLENIPPGPALYVGNHSGGSMVIDSFLFGAAVYRHGGFEDLPYVLAHDFALRLPGLHQVFSAIGAVRASRENADRLLELGKKVVVYPGGSEEALRPFRDRNTIRFGGHRGYVRSALRHGVPIVPVVGQGSHATLIILDDAKWFARLLRLDKTLRIKAWPVALSVPWGLTLFPPPLYLPLPVPIRMRVMEPIRFERSGEEAAMDEAYVAECAARVEGLMQETLTRLAERR